MNGRSDGSIVIDTTVNTKSFDAQINYIEQQMEEIEYKLEQADMGFDVGDTLKLEAEYEKLETRLGNVVKKQREYNEEQKRMPGVEHAKEELEGMGKTFEKNIKQVKRYVLAIFSIRSAYAGIKQAIGTVTSNNQELGNSIEHMKQVLAYTIEPIVKRIVEFVQKMLQYINYIVYAWTGKNLFGDAEKNLKNSNKQAKELKKQLAGIDEATVLTSSSSSGSSSTDMSMFQDLQNMEVPGWIEWIANNKDIVLGFLEALGILMVALKLNEFTEGIRELWTALNENPLKYQKLAGIGLIITGIVTAVSSLIKYLKDPSWENFGGIIAGIGVTIAGIGVLIGAFPVVIAGVIVVILGLIASMWDKINWFFEEFIHNFYSIGDKIMTWLSDKLGWFSVLFNTVIGTIIGVVTGAINMTRSLLDGLFTGVKQILDGIINICRGNFKEGIVQIFKGIGNIIIGILNGLISAINTIVSPIRALVVAVGKVVGKNYTMENIKIPSIPKLERGAIVNNPGYGVNMGSYIAGERGREAILPLTDASAMSELGREIGRYCNINNVVDFNVNGRRLNRIIKQSDDNQRFASNGG